MKTPSKRMIVLLAALAIALALASNYLPADVSDNLIAPKHEVLRMTATECGPYDAVEGDAADLLELEEETIKRVTSYFMGSAAVTYEAVLSPCTTARVGDEIAKLGIKFGTRLQIVADDGEGSFLTIMVLGPHNATVFLLLTGEQGTMVIVMDLVKATPKERQG